MSIQTTSTEITEKTYILGDYASSPRFEGQTSTHDIMTEILLNAIRHNPNTESCCKKSIRYNLIVISGIISAGAKVFFIPINMKLPYGEAFAAGNLGSFFILELWAARGLINDYLGDSSQSLLNDLGKNKISTTKQVLIGGDSAIIGVLSQLPAAFAAAYYNRPSLKITAAIVTLVSGAFFPARSVFLSQKAIFSHQKMEEHEKVIFEYQLKLKDFIHNFRENFLQLKDFKKFELLQEVDRIRKIEDDTELKNAFLKKCTKLDSITQASPSKLRIAGEKAVDVASGILTITFPTALGLYSYSQSQYFLYDNVWFAGTIGIITACAYSYYSGKSFFNTTRRVYNSTIDLLTGKHQKSLAEQIRPKTLFCLRAIGLIFNAFSIGASIVIWGDYFEDYPGIKEYFQATICSSIFLLVFTAMLDTVDDIVRTIILSDDKDAKREWIKLDKELELLEKAIMGCSSEQFNDFLTDDLKSYFLDRIDAARSVDIV